MYLTIDIQHLDNKVKRKSIWIKLTNSWLGFLEKSIFNISNYLIKDVSEMIATLDGFMLHLDDIPLTQVEKIKLSIHALSKRMDDFDNMLYEMDYMNNNELKQKFRHVTKSLHRIEAKLHKRIYAKHEFIDDSNLSNLVASLSQKNVSSSLSNEI